MEHNELIKIMDYCIGNPDFLYELEASELTTLICSSGELFIDDQSSDELKTKVISFLCSLLKTEVTTLEFRCNLWYEILRIIFLSPAYQGVSLEHLAAYRSIFLSLERSIRPLADLSPLPERGRNVVLITSQLLDYSHAPTRSVQEIAYTIQAKLGYPVTIINDSAMHLTTHGILLPAFAYQYCPEYENYTGLGIKDIGVRFYQNPYAIMDTEGIVKMINMIRELKPCLILSMGDGSLLADLCMFMTRTAAMPFAFRMPISLTKYLLLPRPIEPSDSDRLRMCEAYQEVIETSYTYSPDVVEHNPLLTKESLGLHEDDLLCILIGNRLDTDISADLLVLMDRVTCQNDRAHFILVGACNDYQALRAKMSKPDHLIHLGYRSDYLNLLELCHIYVQPHRLGGGRSVFEALNSGTPVVSLPFGDGQYVCGPDFLVEDFNAMEQQILSLLSDRSLYDEMCAKSKARAATLTDTEAVFRHLFSTI